MHKILGEIKCFELEGKWSQSADLEIYNKTYKFWKNIYRDLYSSSNHIQSLSPDNFVLQDKIVTLFHNQEVIGCILFSFHNRKAEPSFDLKYFSGLPSSFTEHAKELKTKHFMTMESLTVHPEWRKKNVGFSLAEILLGFAMRCFSESRAEVLFGTPRNDVGIDKILDRFGGKRIGDFSKSNFPCSFYIFNNEQLILNPSEFDNFSIKRLWNERKMLTKKTAA